MPKKSAKKYPCHALPGAKGSIKPYEPTAEQLRMYNMWSVQLMTYRGISEAVKKNVSSVFTAVKRVDEYYKDLYRDTQEGFRTKHTRALEEIAAKAMKAFDESVGVHEVKTVKDSPGGEDKPGGVETTVRTEKMVGSQAFLAEARAAMAEIRKIWGVDAPAKSEIELTHAEEIPGLPRMGGSGSRSKAMAEAAAALLEAAKRQAELEQK